ncbi:MAG: hypothetical protein ACE5F7_00020 [Nitrospiria bacterium]
MFFAFIFLGLFLWPADVLAEWNVQISTGYSQAKLNLLNTGQLQQTTFIPPRVGGSPGVEGGPVHGIGIEWRIRPRFSLMLKTSFWEGESTAIEESEIQFQDFGIVPFTAKRTTRVSFNEYALHGRYHVLDAPKKHRLYLDIGLFSLIKVNYREDFNYVFDTGNQEFLRNILSRAESEGGYMLEWGVGGDYYLTKWFAVGVDALYRTGKTRQLFYKSFRHTFLERDAVDDAVGVARAIPQPGDPVQYVGPDNVRRILEIDLSGWELTAGIRFFF